MPKASKLSRILVATDFSETSRLALDFAACFAVKFQATVVLLNAITLPQAALEAELKMSAPSLSREIAEQRLQTLAEGLARLQLQVETHVVEGFPADAVLGSLPVYDADMLVLGLHGRGHSFTFLLMGSTTDALLEKAACPILTVGGNVLSGFSLDRDVKAILFVNDYSNTAASSAPYVDFLAQHLGVPVDVLGWLSPPTRDDDAEQEKALKNYRQSLAKYFGEDPPTWSNALSQPAQLSTTDEILSRVEQHPAGLIVAGLHDLQTSLARQLLSRSSAPVITMGPGFLGGKQ